MIAIINYDTEGSFKIQAALRLINADSQITTKENIICEAEKIILPDGNNFNNIVRKLQILNLTNLLKIVRKPILGINLGMILFSEKIMNHKSEGIGLLPMEAASMNFENGTNSTIHKCRIQINKSSELLDGIFEDSQLNFSSKYYYPLNEFSTSQTTLNGEEISASIEYENLFGIQFNPEDSGDDGLIVLKNFVERVEI